MTDFRSSLGWWLGGDGTIALDYGLRTYRIGRGVDEAEAKQAVAELQGDSSRRRSRSRRRAPTA